MLMKYGQLRRKTDYILIHGEKEFNFVPFHFKLQEQHNAAVLKLQ